MKENGLAIELDYLGMAHEHPDPVIIQRGPIDNCASFYKNGKIILLSGKNEVKLKLNENKLLHSDNRRIPYEC